VQNQYEIAKETMEMVTDRRSDIYFSIFLKSHEFLTAKYNNNISFKNNKQTKYTAQCQHEHHHHPGRLPARLPRHLLFGHHRARRCGHQSARQPGPPHDRRRAASDTATPMEVLLLAGLVTVTALAEMVQASGA
jgi:hypothetical protein